VAADPSSPSRFTPMGLVLSYQLTAHSDITGGPGNGTLEEQFLLGLAMLALRNVACVDDTTTVNGGLVMPPAMRGHNNRLHIVQEPIKASEAVEYWTAGTHALRLAAYYEVTAIQLEPDPLDHLTGRVLTYSSPAFVAGVPRLTATTNRLDVVVPGDPTPHPVDASPAEVAVGASFSVMGSGLAGDAVEVRVREADWPTTEPADPLLWSVAATDTAVELTVGPQAGDQTVLPGLYSLTVAVGRDIATSDGTTRRLTAESNAVPFVVVPRIDSVAVGAVVTVDGGPFAPAVLPGDLIRVVLGSQPLTRTAAAPGPGEFRVVDDATISLRPSASAPLGAPLPLRVLVRGAESAPTWVVLT
jgi:hypothetical protein